jgi:hypothetical protein
MPTAKKKTKVTVQTHVEANFSVDIEYRNWRYAGQKRWKPEELLTDEERDAGGHLKFWDEIFFELLEKIVPLDQGLESTTAGMEALFTINMDECPKSVAQIQKEVGILADVMNRGGPIMSDQEPYIYNKSGRADYHDPSWRYGKFILPKSK